MTPELKKYYEDRFTLFATKGWQDLIEDAQEMIVSYNSISNINNVEDLYKRQGQLDILMWLTSLKEISEKAYEDLNEEAV